MWAVNYPQVFRDRACYMLAGRSNPDTRAIYRRCYGKAMDAEACIQWIEAWCFTYDPRKQVGLKTLPFILFDRQKDFVRFILECIRDGESGIVEKCRDAGMTWLCVCIAVWLWLYHNDVSIGFGSAKEMKVDRLGDPDSIFEKIRLVLRSLPPWMLPAGFDWRQHNNFLKIINPENGATITGEAGDNIGRGGRKTVYFKDESAHYERPELIEAALSATTNVQIDISSVNGSANVFYRRRANAVEWQQGVVIPRGKVRLFIFDWTQDPRKDRTWYDEKKQKAIDEGLLHIFAQEVERDYAGSLEGVIIKGEWARACLDADKIIAARKFGDIANENERAQKIADYLALWRKGERIAAQDVADGGHDRNAYASREGVVLKRCTAWGGEAGPAAQEAVPFAIEDAVLELYYDCIGVGTGFKVEINHMKDKPNWPRKLRVMPWDATANPLNPEDPSILGDADSPKNEDIYENLKAQAWFLLRARIWKTFLAVTQGRDFPVDEMICFPADLPGVQQMIMELSQAVKKVSLSSGKTVVDKKPDGSMSPNMADSVVMCYCPTREVSIFDVL